ncbi:MAG: head GIN domain-containing protein [Bacteroidota bacterium]
MRTRLIKYLSYTFLLSIVWACDSDQGLNCFQAAGEIVQQEYEVQTFEKILVRERVQLILTEGPEQRVVVETGANLMNDIIVKSLNNTLSVKNDNGCNLVRDYGITKVFVTSPNITQIRNSSGLAVETGGVLTYDELILISEDEENEDEFHIDGDFRMDLEVGSLQIIGTGLSNFFLTGSADHARFELFNGDGRIEAANFEVSDLYVFHRGTQKMIVHPIDSISGEIRSFGDVISVNEPPFVDVQEFFEGKLIFEQP